VSVLQLPSAQKRPLIKQIFTQTLNNRKKKGPTNPPTTENNNARVSEVERRRKTRRRKNASGGSERQQQRRIIGIISLLFTTTTTTAGVETVREILFHSVSCFSGKISIDLLRALFLSDIFIKTRARVVSFDFSTLYTHRERYRCAFRVEKREHIKKKACGNTLVRVFDSSASREGTRAPGEETQGIRPPFLNFFLYIYVFLSFNACVINLSLSLSLSGSF